MALDVFCEIPCLTERSRTLNGLALQKKWFKRSDKRIIGQYLQKFIDYNSTLFDFIGAQPYIIGTDQNTSLTFRTTQFIGAIPLRASDTGKQIGDFVIVPRFSGRDRFEDYIEILDLLGSEISPEVVDSLPLASGRNFTPPLYLEALKFIAALENLLRTHWRKFDNIEFLSFEPKAQIKWTKYILSQYKVENRLRFPIQTNILSEFHKEFSQIRYVFDICKKELLSSNTPQRLRHSIRGKLSWLEEKLYLHKPMLVNEISIRASDNLAIKNCKQQANKILKQRFTDSTAWRVDFSDVFEKFVQYIFKEVAKEVGGRVFLNYRFPSRTSKYFSWELRHIEPDIIYQKANISIVADAKYKSNLYNRFDLSDILKDDHRHDLHQILAYASFNNDTLKHGILCYPSHEVEVKATIFRNALNEATTTILICGIPLKKERLTEAKTLLIQEFNKIGQTADRISVTEARS